MTDHTQIEQQQFAISTGKENMGIVSPLSVTWRELTARLSTPKIGSKEGSFWCPASFATNSRKLENVKAVALIVLDVEQKATTPPPLRDALTACAGLNWTAFAHTSYKHTAESPRYRLILQPDRPIEPGRLRAVITAVADRLGLSTCTDLAASCDAARLYYLPRVPHGAARALFECVGYEGVAVGLDSLTAPAKPDLMPVAPQAPAVRPYLAPDRQQVISDLRDALRYLSPDNYADWITGGHDLYRLGDEGLALWTEWSMRSPKWKPTDAAKWPSFKDTHSDYPAVFKRAQECGWRNPASGTRHNTTAREDFAQGMADHAAQEEIEHDNHRNTPTPSAACLYGFVGDVARAAHAANREVNPYATALNMMVLMAAGIGRGTTMPIGDDWHHTRIFGLHVGRSGRGRKGTSGKLPGQVQRMMAERHPDIAFQTHTGGLSSREGLVMKIHDGFRQGKDDVPPVLDKRLSILESEFANVLHQAAREGNTLSAALRDAWDGTCIKPATKTAPISATRPHINLMGHITPSELLDCMKSRELSNGFANRFLMIWAEQGELDPLPGFTPDVLVAELADRMAGILRHAKADRYADGNHTRMTFTAAARDLYVKLYKGEFQDRSGGELVAGMMTRQAPYLVRLAMLFAVTDKAGQIDTPHIEAAHAWVRYWRDSVKFIFASARDEAEAQTLQATIKQLVEFLRAIGEATRVELIKSCFKGHVSKSVLDAALDDLLTQTPPVITVTDKPRSTPGRSAKVYRMNTAAKFANNANNGSGAGQNQTSPAPRTLRTLRTLVEPHSTVMPENPSPEPMFANFANFAQPAKLAETQAQSQCSQTSQTSHGFSDSADDSIPADGVF